MFPGKNNCKSSRALTFRLQFSPVFSLQKPFNAIGTGHPFIVSKAGLPDIYFTILVGSVI